ncbi:phage portal protein family protein [Reichenbachiella sp.]|uniref:phage portal protein family protein n=1 Tax=Reichenbachiella sp. TaxID=2184521 RepID=UPI003B5AD3FB
MNYLNKLVLSYVNSTESLRAQILKDHQNDEYIKLMKQQKVLSRIEVKHWRGAHQCAIDIDRPDRSELMDVFDDAVLDPHLITTLQTRFLNVLNIPAEIYDLESGETDSDLTPLIQKKWFYDATRMILESIPFGFTPEQWSFKPGKDLQWEVARVRVFPREHCVPEWNAIRPDVNGDELIYLHDEKYSRHYMIIDSGELGLLLPASRYTIFKKYAINHWNRYQDIFGIPPVTATTNSRDEAIWDKIETNLKAMSNSLGSIFPEGTDLKVHENTNTDVYNLFLQAAKYADEQISKLFLGGSGSTDEKSHVGSAEVHERTKNDYTKADVRLCEHIWNDKYLPFLTSWGYPLEGKGVRFNMSSKLKLADSQLAIDTWIGENFDIDEQYIEKTYGTPVIGRKTSGTAPDTDPASSTSEGK